MGSSLLNITDRICKYVLPNDIKTRDSYLLIIYMNSCPSHRQTYAFFKLGKMVTALMTYSFFEIVSLQRFMGFSHGVCICVCSVFLSDVVQIYSCSRVQSSETQHPKTLQP